MPEDVTARVLRARPAHVRAHAVEHRASLPRRVPVDGNPFEEVEPAAVNELGAQVIESRGEGWEWEVVRGEVDDVEAGGLRGRQRGVELGDLVVGEPVRPRARVRGEVGAEPTPGEGGKMMTFGRRRRGR